MTRGALAVARTEGGAVLELELAAPPANLLADEVVRGLDAAVAGVGDRDVRAVLLRARGPHFCYGADVAEHEPANAAASVRLFHALVRRVLACEVPTACAVRGRCLGGGLELASACDVVVARPDATFALPEVRLGVFAPVGSILLRERVGDGVARELLLSGRAIDAAEALRTGLVQHVADDPDEAARAWIRAHVLAASPSGMRVAVRAARLPLVRRALPLLEEMERLYVDEAASSPDAAEGVAAFLAKRPPSWGADAAG